MSDVPANHRHGGDIRILLSPTTAGATSGFMGVLTLQPGEYVSEHYHPYSEEFFFLVSGALTLRVDGAPVDLAAGQSTLIPREARHRVENNGSAEAFAVFHLCPLAPRPELGHVDTEPPPEAPEVPAP
ncbi:cupin domain-containing protein [Actinomadura chokoriensis]|uniref:Cupin domain-containing protein n=1 Tax=Actinomadura chokoriensis TaxID=454156 RepID=A0ABV4R2L9_9ACTN